MNRSPATRAHWMILFAIACAVVIWFSLIPAKDLPKLWLTDKAEHAISYAGLAFLGLLAFPGRYGRLAIGLLALGILIEILQGVMGWGRDADVYDALADAVGIAVGTAVILLAIPVLRRARR